MTEPLVLAAGLVVVVGGERLVGRLVRRTDTFERVEDDVLASDLTKWLGLLPLAVWVVGIERAGVSSLTGTRLDPASFLGVIVGGVVVTFLASAVIQRATSVVGIDGVASGETMSQISGRSTPAILFTAVTAGVTEELLFRGFLIERLIELTGRPIVAGVVSLVVFGAAHYGYWNVGETIEITAQGGVLVVIYLFVPSILAVITIHAIHDALGMLIARRVRHEDDRRRSDHSADA